MDGAGGGVGVQRGLLGAGTAGARLVSRYGSDAGGRSARRPVGALRRARAASGDDR
ncbi:hypothetical protein STRIP9103_01065 [Streptomyces ipomoeae 91-03]|uniref:Uncharacterized protein n=1 Tax=Streptomyces ipomoeae 91-03 TaxID=698759 RepID=L1KVP6_9ACTN|nr:hypothetical protein STRIP9103_01065 [Streptomyces ipomoeae 91-03]